MNKENPETYLASLITIAFIVRSLDVNPYLFPPFLLHHPRGTNCNGGPSPSQLLFHNEIYHESRKFLKAGQKVRGAFSYSSYFRRPTFLINDN